MNKHTALYKVNKIRFEILFQGIELSGPLVRRRNKHLSQRGKKCRELQNLESVSHYVIRNAPETNCNNQI